MASLTSAARHSDVHIATDVFRILSERGTAFAPHHYELLMSAHLGAGDLRTALTILCIMHSVQLNPDLETLSALRAYLFSDPSAPQNAFELLKQLATERDVPTVAVNAIIMSLVDHNRHADVISTYKSLHQLSTAGPNVHTFNALFRSCHRNNDKRTAMFFAAEMVELKIKPDALTYDRLVLVCIREANYEDAWRYYGEMTQAGYVPRLGTFVTMVQVCADAKDERALELVERMVELGLPTVSAQKAVREMWPEKVEELPLVGEKGMGSVSLRGKVVSI